MAAKHEQAMAVSTSNVQTRLEGINDMAQRTEEYAMMLSQAIVCAFPCLTHKPMLTFTGPYFIQTSKLGRPARYDGRGKTPDIPSSNC